ncbi:MAG: FecR family protein [Candidatus Nitrospinota bacterium M3_3B_026]
MMAPRLFRSFTTAFTIASLLIAGGYSHAQESSIAAEAVHVEGAASYVSVDDEKTYPVEVKTPFREGDRVSTGADGIVEISFDTGDLMLVDNDTELLIRSLSRSGEASSSVFGLELGRVKSYVTKLSGKESKFEIHTRAAISGVAGTEYVVETKDDTTNVYNTSEANGGDIFVEGRDPSKTRITLPPGMGTKVVAGLAPVAPFVIEPELLKSLEQLIFRSRGGAAAGGESAAAASKDTALVAGMSGTTVAAIGGGAALTAVAVAGSSSGGGGGGGDDGGGAPKDVTGTWDMYLRCSSQSSDAAKVTLNINESSGGRFTGSGSGTDYNGTPMSIRIEGTFDSSSKVMSGRITTTFEGGDCTRVDEFSVTLSSNDTGYISTNQTQVCGCDALIRLVKK